MSEAARARLAVGALAGILVIAGGWWLLALWPADAGLPSWVLRTRDVCFGSTPDGLPEPGGWILLIGQPLGMLAVLAIVWGAELKAGLAELMTRVTGQLTVGTVAALIVAGGWSAGVRVRTAGLEPFSTGGADLAAQLTRIDDPAPELALVDQRGRTVTLAAFRGRPVIVAFAYAHCETVCPAIVADALGARARAAESDPAVLVVTLDPWRDTPSRLPAMAEQWDLGTRAHVLSGTPEIVERTLNAWRVPRARNEKTGEIMHPAMVYVVDRTGRLAYVTIGGAEVVSAAVKSL